MSKRTLYSPWAVQQYAPDRPNFTDWRTVSYENSERMARRAVRDGIKHHGGQWRAVRNPNLSERPNVDA
jgi:hypothetical protein